LPITTTSARTTAQDWFARRPWIDEPDASIDAYVKSVNSPPVDYDLKAQLLHWREHGIVIFENAVPHSIIDSLLADIDCLVRNPKEYELTVDLGDGKPHQPIKEVPSSDLLGRESLKLNNVHFLSKAAIQCALNLFAGSFLRHIFRDTPCVQQSLFFIKGSQQPIHLDYPYVRVQQHIANLAASWVALEDVHEDSGPLEYYCGSHMPEKMPFFDWGNESITFEKDSTKQPSEFVHYLREQMQQLNITPRVFLPKKGDMLIWHGYLAHGGTKIRDRSKTRRSLVAHYTAKGSYNPTHKFPDADEKKRYFSQNGGIAYDLPWTRDWKMLPSWKN
jgi:phytanoyl-CoA hydroxylase